MDGIEDSSRTPAAAALVSIVIICYNQARFLGEAIESVRRQTYGHYEIVVADDGSTDNPAEVAARYPGVRFMTQPNQGAAGATRNWGFRESQGDYLVFLDADDRLLPNALEIGVESLEAHPECGLAVGQYSLIATDGTPLPTTHKECTVEDHYVAFLRWDHIWTVASVMFRRSAFEAVGGFDGSAAMKGTDDFDIFLRLGRKFPVCCHQQRNAEYRVHSSNTSHNVELMWQSSLAVFRSEWEAVKGNKEYEAAYRIGLQRCLDFYGEQLVGQARAHAKKHGERKQALRAVWALARIHPRAFLSHACRKSYCFLFRVKSDFAG